MTRRQLGEDVYNAESEHDFDHEEDQAQYEHYRVNGNAPRLMPDFRRLVPGDGGWSHIGKDGLSIWE